MEWAKKRTQACLLLVRPRWLLSSELQSLRFLAQLLPFSCELRLAAPPNLVDELLVGASLGSNEERMKTKDNKPK